MNRITVGIVLSLMAVPFAAGIADDSTPRLHLVEAACIDYESSGQMQQGTTTRCHRDYAYEAYEIQDVTVGFGGFSQTQNQHSITIGNTIYAIDLTTNSGTKTINPMYDQMVNAMSSSDPAEVMDSFLASFGFTPAGESKNIAGVDCNVYTSNMLGTACLTDDGLMLEQVVMGNTMIATSVSIGASGEDDNYRLYETVSITDGPDLSNMPSLQDIINQAQQQ